MVESLLHEQLFVMKGALIALGIGFALVTFLCLKTNFDSSTRTVDIHLTDTYFKVTYSTALLIFLLFLGTLFSLGGLIGTFFKNKWFLILTLVFLVADIYLLLNFYSGMTNR